jgi:uncharacterized protein
VCFPGRTVSRPANACLLERLLSRPTGQAFYDAEMRGLAFVGGWAHPAAQTGPTVAAALGAVGVDTEVVDSFDDAASRLVSGDVDLLIVHTCRFLMTDARYTPQQRATFGSSTPTDFRTAVAHHVAAGRPLLALHTAVLCFDDWEEWSQTVGGRWDWERSNHPPPGVFTVTPVEALSTACQPFEVTDELYRFVEPLAGSEVIATAMDPSGVTHPLAWRIQHRLGARVAYSSLGHDVRSLEDPGHRTFLGALVAWLVHST